MSSLHSHPASPPEARAVDGEGPQQTRRDRNHNKEELKRQRQASNKPPRLDNLSSSLPHHSRSPPASPLEAGAVGGDGTPQPSDSRFKAAAKEADEDFSNQQNQPAIKTKTTHPNDKYFEDDRFPRFLVIKHRNSSVNITKLNTFHIDDGLREVLSERQYEAMTMKYQFHSQLILLDVDGRSAAKKLLATKELKNIPIKVEVHKTKNTVKGTIFTSNYHDMSDAELQGRLAGQGVVEVFNVPKRDKSGKSPRYFLTFTGQTLPDRILAGGLSIKVEAVKNTPRRCPRCQQFGHGERACNNNRVCCRCGQASEHTYRECPNEESCFNCGQKHAASSTQCPVFQFEEAVIREKTGTNISDTAARQNQLRSHHLVETVPKLKQEREKLPLTAAEMVARSKGRPNPAPVRPNNGHPPPQSDISQQLLKRLEDQMSKQNQLLQNQETLITQQASTIRTLQACMMAMVNAPAINLAVDGSLKNLLDRGEISEDQHAAAGVLLTKSVDQATDARKSRSRSRRPSTNSRDNRSTSNKSLPRGSKSGGPQDSSKKSPPRPSRGLGSLPSTPSKKRKADGTPGSPSSAGSSPASPVSRPKQAEHVQAPGKKANRDKSPVAPARKAEPLPSSSHLTKNTAASKNEEQPPPVAPPPLPPSAPPPPSLSGLSLSVEDLLTQDRAMDLSGRNGEDYSTKSRAGTSPAYPVVTQDGTVKHVCRTSRKT